jgi:predicted ATPase
MGHVERGLEQMVESLKAHTITRSRLLRPYYFVLYAGSLLRAGRLDEAQQALDEAASIATESSQHAYDAEHARLQAEVLIAMRQPEAAERMYQEAIRISRAQGARWLELRGARAYANYLAGVNRTSEARTVLEPVCAALSDGVGTLDFVAAEAMLKTLT